MVRSNISLNYTSTVEDSLLTFQCEDGLFPDDVFTARCYRNGSWIPNPSSHTCTTSSAGTSMTNHTQLLTNYCFDGLLVNCGELSPPSDGYLEPYTSTYEGAKVNRVQVCQNGQQSQIEQIICSSNGQWKIINGSTCSAIPGTRPYSRVVHVALKFT